MTEQEAAERLLALLTEIEAAGHPVFIDHVDDTPQLFVGTFAYLVAPVMSDGVWTLEMDQ